MSLLQTPNQILAELNAAHLSHRLSMVDELKTMGYFGTPILLMMVALPIAGVILIFLRPHMGARLAYSILCLLPAVFGLMGMLSALRGMFASLGVSGMADGPGLMLAFSEISRVLVFGLFVSAFAMSLAILVWLMPKRERSAPPQLPIE